MKITTVHDDETGTVEITLHCRADADPDLTADQASAAVSAALSPTDPPPSS